MRLSGRVLEPNTEGVEPWGIEYDKRTKVFMQKLREDSSKAVANNLKGYLYEHAVADGCALYVVTDDTGKSLTLTWVKVWDAYRVHPQTLRGMTRKNMVDNFNFKNRLKKFTL